MRAFKGFNQDLTCRGYQFMESGVKRTEEANCHDNGFHCAENPLDCLDYYPDWKESVYYEVEAAGDLDEDAIDSKIACTNLRLVKKLSFKELLFEGLVYMVRHPKRKWNSHVQRDSGTAKNGYAVVCGAEPMACGMEGDFLALIKEDEKTQEVLEVGLFQVGRSRCRAGIWYDVHGNCMEGMADEKSGAV